MSFVGSSPFEEVPNEQDVCARPSDAGCGRVRHRAGLVRNTGTPRRYILTVSRDQEIARGGVVTMSVLDEFFDAVCPGCGAERPVHGTVEDMLDCEIHAASGREEW